VIAEERPPGPSAAAETEWDQKEMSFTEHLAELRNRLMVVVAVVGVLGVVMFIPAPWVISKLRDLYLPGVQLNAFSPTDVIFTEFKFAIYSAIVLGLPVIVYQVWMFIVPAFHPRTRGIVYGYTLPSLLLALTGIAFCHFFIIKRVLGALVGITEGIATPTFGIESTLNLILLMFLAFAIVFETPMVMIALARIGLVNVPMLRKYRRYAAFIILFLGGLFAPDASPITMLMLAVPMYVLYEASIIAISVLEKSWRAPARKA
jgi:sec-independent protein translocase protein TatC